ncbi:unnamed protein product, partial [Anisakis simplex]|uniref:Ccr4-not transcription complex, putative (inferred by orthology to a S. mansoni protein) n=1 Tax=Anisakis simplex TaxID=6269 RepID=A0A0M3JE95_ANISI
MEKVSFLFNNLSQSNLPKKTEEMKAMMAEYGEDFVRWLAQYMVMKRVSIEQNFQPLYNNFLIAIGDEQLEKFVKQETFRNIKSSNSGESFFLLCVYCEFGERTKSGQEKDADLSD